MLVGSIPIFRSLLQLSHDFPVSATFGLHNWCLRERGDGAADIVASSQMSSQASIALRGRIVISSMTRNNALGPWF